MSSVVKRDNHAMMTTPFARWLERTREDLGWSKAALAKASGVDRAYIQRLEAGTVAEPGDNVRARLHTALGTSDDDLVDAGLYERREYPQPDGSTMVTYTPLPLIPPAQVPTPTAANGEGDTVTIPADDPRARVVAALDGLPDHAVTGWASAIEAVVMATGANAKRGVDSPEGTRKRSDTA